MRFCLPGRFLPVFVCITQILVGGGSSYSSFPPTPGGTRPPTPISLQTGYLSWLWADSPTNLWAIQPTCREITDFKKAVSQRVKAIVFILAQNVQNYTLDCKMKLSTVAWVSLSSDSMKLPQMHPAIREKDVIWKNQHIYCYVCFLLLYFDGHILFILNTRLA